MLSFRKESTDIATNKLKDEIVNTTIKELLALVKGQTAEQAFQQVDQYFQNIMFSLEADEWKVRMSQIEKEKFIAALITKC